MRCGGGVNHRFSLADMAMVKDNHVIAAGGVVPALRGGPRRRTPDLPVEVEVTDLDQLRELLDAGCDRILLDNMDDRDDGRGGARSPPAARTLEASGGLTLDRAREVARDRGRLHLGRGTDPLGGGLRPRHGPPGGRDDAPRRRHRQQPHRARAARRTARSLAHWRVATDERRTADEWAVLLRGLLARRARRTSTASRSARPCPAVLHEWRDMLAATSRDVPSVVVEPGIRTGVPVLMDNPREVGADRIINALAAATLYGGPAIVVDFGGPRRPSTW